MRRVQALALLALSLAGCSYLQTKAVGDEYVQGTRTALVEVLAGEGLATRRGPDCVVNEDATALECTAETTTGASVEANAAGGDSNDLDAAELTVSVAGDTVFTGSVAGVLERENE